MSSNASGIKLEHNTTSFQSNRYYTTGNMEKLKDYRVFLEMLSKSNPKYRKSLINGAPPEIMKVLSECALNILKGTITLTNDEKTKLRKHKNQLRQMATTRVSNRQKKKIVQKGGMLKALLKPVLKATLPLVVNHIVNSL